MAEVVQRAQQEFWRPAVISECLPEIAISAVLPTMAEACSGCGTEFMIGSRFCHVCGAHRPEKNNKTMQAILSRPATGAFLCRCGSIPGQDCAAALASLPALSRDQALDWLADALPDCLHYRLGMCCRSPCCQPFLQGVKHGGIPGNPDVAD
jgi:hypothetical protein